jgi:glycosyltransferase involved in cell wall biosynthesis
MTELSIVVPCYNEQEVLPETCRRLAAVLTRLRDAERISASSRIYFVDDGSRDGTWALIKSFCDQRLPVVGIKLARNRGHQNALLAGLYSAHGDALVSIDADLQDDVNVIEKMLDHFDDGCDVVYGVRNHRDTDSFFKRITAKAFYRIIGWMGASTIDNHADFRLMSRRAVDALKGYREVNLFLRGLIPLIGYRSATVEFNRAVRFAGESKYPFRKMLGLALDAVTSFSIFPLRVISVLGFFVSLGSVVVTGWALWTALLTDKAIPGWASTVAPMYFLGGVQLLCLGVIGEYVGKMYLEVKERPRFLIEETVGSWQAVGVDEHHFQTVSI